MNYKLIATDLDGTLLNSQMKLSPENVAAMEQLAQKGVSVVASTGRSLAEINEGLREMPQLQYFITSNGAATFRRDGECIISLGVEGEDKKFLLETLRKYRSVYTIHFRGRAYCDRDRMNRENYRLCKMTDLFIDHVYAVVDPIRDFDAYCDNETLVESCCCFFPSAEELEGCRQALLAHGGFEVTASMPDNLEIYSKHAGKGNALLALAERLGIDPAATIGVGDGTNDADNLQKAGLGLAVSNTDPALLPYADQTICSNDEHIMEYILHHIIMN